VNRLVWTPWGNPDQIEKLAEGIDSVSTPGHGGIMLDTDHAERMKATGFKPWTKDFRFWEEDADWACVFVTFADELRGTEDFPKYLEIAMATVKQYHGAKA
jgi:hypothetical protein